MKNIALISAWLFLSGFMFPSSDPPRPVPQPVYVCADLDEGAQPPVCRQWIKIYIKTQELSAPAQLNFKIPLRTQ